MKIIFECRLSCPAEKVVERFGEDLFRALSPPFPRLKILQFDGIKTGDHVVLQLDFMLFTGHWSSLITSSHKSDHALVFVDVGEVMPPFLSRWEHRHVIEKVRNGSIIRDEIEFSPGKGWPAWLVWLMIWIQMKPRNRIYTSFFRC